MEAEYIADRSLLLTLWHQHPEWSNAALAQVTKRSLAWIKKWKARFRAAPNPAEAVWSRPREHPTGTRFSLAVIEAILAMRDYPPEHLHRTPGPRTIV